MQFKSYVMAKSMVASCGLAIVLSGCSSSGSDKVNLNSLASIPSTSQLVGGSSSSSTSLSRYALTLGATGTPPLMSSLASGTSADQYFWNGLVQDIIDSEVVIDDSIRSQFYGMTADSAGGMGACQMVQSVGQAMERITENAATICYMKKIPTVAEIVPQNGNAETTSDEVFSQQSEDRWVISIR